MALGHAVALVGFLAAQIASEPRLPVSPPSGWQRISPPYDEVVSVSVARDRNESLYAAATDHASGQSGVFRSEDAGIRWTLVGSALAGETVRSVAVDPRDASQVFATTGNTEMNFSRLYVSSDAGSTWRFVESDEGACGGSFFFDRLRPTVYVGFRCSGVVLVSEDGGSSWSEREKRLTLLSVDPDGLVYGLGYEEEGQQLLRSDDGARIWTEIGAPRCPYGTSVQAVATDLKGRLVAGTGRPQMMFHLCPGLHRSFDGGRSWSQLFDRFVAGIVFDESQPERLWVWTSLFGSGSVFESTNDGFDWTDLNLPSEANQVVLSASGRFLFAATNAGLFRLMASTEQKTWPPTAGPRTATPQAQPPR